MENARGSVRAGLLASVTVIVNGKVPVGPLTALGMLRRPLVERFSQGGMPVAVHV
jgi:hypothetical protein